MPKRRKRRRRSCLTKGLILGFGIPVLLFLILYIVFAVYFRSHFLWRTEINGLSVSGMTPDEAKDKIDSLKKNEIVYTDVQSNGTEKKVPTGVTYGDALDKKAKTTVWYYEDTTNGGFRITYYGTKVSMDLAKYGSDGTYIDKTLKAVFDFPAGGKSTVTLYIGDEQCDDAMKAAVLQALAN